MIPKWQATLDYLEAHPHGVTREDLEYEFGLSRSGARLRVKNLRSALQEHPEIGRALPRPTMGNGWLYRITNLFIEPHEADIRAGNIEDNKQILAMLRRLEFEVDTAYDREVADHGKRFARSKQLKALGGDLAAIIERIESDLGGIIKMK
jgi:hypothetical protein